MNHEISIIERVISIDYGETIVQNGVKSDKLTIIFDNEWKSLDSIVVVFENGDEVIKVAIVDDTNTVDVPWEVLQDIGDLYVTVVGYVGDEMRVVTEKMVEPFKVVPSGSIDGEQNQDPTPDALQQSMTIINERLVELELKRIEMNKEFEELKAQLINQVIPDGSVTTEKVDFLPLSIANGGTGGTTEREARNNLLSGTKNYQVYSEDLENSTVKICAIGDDGSYIGKGNFGTFKPSKIKDWIFEKIRSVFGFSEDNILPASNGGTGVTSLADLRNALGLGSNLGTLDVANGGTGATSIAGILSNLGIKAHISSVGKSGNWKYVKFDNGMAILHYQKGHTASETMTQGAVYSYKETTISFPFALSRYVPIASTDITGYHDIYVTWTGDSSLIYRFSDLGKGSTLGNACKAHVFILGWV